MSMLTPFPACIQSVPYFLTDKVVEFIYPVKSMPPLTTLGGQRCVLFVLLITP